VVPPPGVATAAAPLCDIGRHEPLSIRPAGGFRLKLPRWRMRMGGMNYREQRRLYKAAQDLEKLRRRDARIWNCWAWMVVLLAILVHSSRSQESPHLHGAILPLIVAAILYGGLHGGDRLFQTYQHPYDNYRFPPERDDDR